MSPNGAILLVIIIKFFVLKIKLAIESKAMQVKEAKPSQAEGT
jgi:hypothetical protein